jgi:hypothetical protein
MVVAIPTGHAPVRRHLYIMGLFNRDPACRFCRMETETVQHIICCCEALARQRYNVFGKLTAEPKDISTTSVRAEKVLVLKEEELDHRLWRTRFGRGYGPVVGQTTY